MKREQSVIEQRVPAAGRPAGRRWIALAILTAIQLGVSIAPASAEGDARTGGWLAQHWCGGCHGSGVDVVSDATPSLLSIARQSHTDPRWLRVWLADAHPRMPNFALSRSEIDDIVAYLETLATR
jgi:mono/diheme cytochrome c family protein